MCSTFFWLVLRGKGEGGVRNSDYSVSKEKHLIAKVKEAGFSNGLHKAASGLSFADELKLPSRSRGGKQVPLLEIQSPRRLE